MRREEDPVPSPVGHQWMTYTECGPSPCYLIRVPLKIGFKALPHRASNSKVRAESEEDLVVYCVKGCREVKKNQK